MSVEAATEATPLLAHAKAFADLDRWQAMETNEGNIIPDVNQTFDLVNRLRKTKDITSRTILTLSAIEVIGGALRWTRSDAKFQFVNDSTDLDSDAAWVFFPALGLDDTFEPAIAMAPALADAPVLHGRTASLRMPQRKPRIATIGNSFRDFVTDNKIKHVRPICLSTGGLLAGHVLPYLPADVDVDAAAFINSPSSIYDVRNDTRSAQALNRIGHTGGLVTKPLVALISYRSPAESSFFDKLQDRAVAIWQSVGPGACSPYTWSFMMNLLCKSQLECVGRNFKQRLTPDAAVAYVLSDPPTSDTMVAVENALPSYQTAIGHPIERRPIAGTNHASMEHVDKYIAEIAAWLGGVARESGVEKSA